MEDLRTPRSGCRHIEDTRPAYWLILGLVLAALSASAPPSFAQSGYLTRIPDSIDPSSGEVVVIDAARDVVRATIPMGENPINLAVTPDRTKVYVASYLSDQVYVIDPASNLIAAKFGLGFGMGHYLSRQMAVSPDGQKIYELNEYPGNMSVIHVASNTAPTAIGVGDHPTDLALRT